jgi:hypothetical protein
MLLTLIIVFRATLTINSAANYQCSFEFGDLSIHSNSGECPLN